MTLTYIIIGLLSAILAVLTRISRLLYLVVIQTRKEAVSIIIYQKDGNMANGPIKGVPVGGQGRFDFAPNPAGSVFTPPLTVLSNDPLAVVVYNPGDTFCLINADPTAPVGGQFTLSVSFKRDDGNQAAGLAQVPYLPAAAPPQAQTIDITQTA